MEQKPIPGYDALTPPDADIAQHYLNEAKAVATRRDHAVDRRALAWLQIANAVVTAVYLTAYAFLLREDVSLVPQIVLFTFLIWTQLAAGMAQRNGMQWRMTRARWPILVAAGVVLAGAMIVFGFAIWNADLPDWVLLLPGVILLVSLGGYGVIQLIRASSDPRPSALRRSALPRGIRLGTILVGIVIAVFILLVGTPDDLVGGILLLLMALLLIAGLVTAKSEFGLQAIGARWRWPHVLAFGAAVSPLLWRAVLVPDGETPSMPVIGALAAGAAALLIAVSFVPGRDPRD